VKQLAAAGLLAPVENGRYGLGPRIIQLDRQLRVSDPMIGAMQAIEPQLPRWAADQAWLLCRLFKDRVLCIHRSGTLRTRLSFSRGFPMPLFRGATAKVVLAYLSDHHQRRLYRDERKRIEESGLGASWPEFRAAMMGIREHGYAGTVAEADPGVFGIAAPILAADGRVIGSLSNVRAVARLDLSRWPREGAELIDIARRIGAGMHAKHAPAVPVE